MKINGFNGRRSFPVWLLVMITPPVLFCCVLVGASGLSIDDWQTSIGRAVITLRISRIICGFAVGAGLACSGVVLQALLRNPLADPYVLGVSNGAALGAAAAIIAGLGGMFALPLFAFMGALVSLLVVLLLAYRGGTTNIYSLLLSGIIVGSICSSVLMLIISIAPVEGMHGIMWWMLGNLQSASIPLLAGGVILIAIGFALVWVMARQLNALALGGEMAHHLGVPVKTVIIVFVVLATLTAASAVALAGLIGFVGLIIPHLMRMVVGPDHQRLVPASTLAGGLFLVLCDTAARTVLAPLEIPVGVVTALIGGPFFIFLLRRRAGGWFE